MYDCLFLCYSQCLTRLWCPLSCRWAVCSPAEQREGTTPGYRLWSEWHCGWSGSLLPSRPEKRKESIFKPHTWNVPTVMKIQLLTWSMSACGECTKMEAFSLGEDSRQSCASVALALYVKAMKLASLPSYSTCLWCSAKWISLSDLNLNVLWKMTKNKTGEERQVMGQTEWFLLLVHPLNVHYVLSFNYNLIN